jgi:23S rRNA (cytosine1962-C5)-methyltransferase
MDILFPTTWVDYQLLDTGDGQRLEKFGPYTLIRPDPQIIWHKHLPKETWTKADATFTRDTADKGTWKTWTKVPGQWPMRWKELTFLARLTPFKHTGVFPEQAVHWEWLQDLIRQRSNQPNILNLFGYTGGATLASVTAGAKVTHLDASRPAIAWARENQEAAGLTDKPIRWIIDDAVKFVTRELKRGTKYDGILMDPPVYGHGPEGEIWSFEKSLPELLNLCRRVLSPNPLFLLINAYAVSTSAVTLANVLGDITKDLSGEITYGELGLKEIASPRILSTGIWARWEIPD